MHEKGATVATDAKQTRTDILEEAIIFCEIDCACLRMLVFLCYNMLRWATGTAIQVSFGIDYWYCPFLPRPVYYSSSQFSLYVGVVWV